MMYDKGVQLAAVHDTNETDAYTKYVMACSMCSEAVMKVTVCRW